MAIEHERVTREGPRARTESIKRLSKRALRAGAEETADYTESLPATWGECQSRGLGTPENPCWFARCKYSLLLDINEATGAIKVNHPGALDGTGALDPSVLRETCVLRVAAVERTLEETGMLYNLTRERVRQIEMKGLAALKELASLARLQDWIDVEATHGIKPEVEHDSTPTVHAASKGVAAATGTKPRGFTRETVTIRPLVGPGSLARINRTYRECSEGDGYVVSRIDPLDGLQQSLTFTVGERE